MVDEREKAGVAANFWIEGFSGCAAGPVSETENVRKVIELGRFLVHGGLTSKGRCPVGPGDGQWASSSLERTG